jgi:acetyltransferase-like isoleucine patch superfamily enzyme
VKGIVLGLYHRVRKSFEMRRSTPYTRADYLRLQGAQVGDNCFIVPTFVGTEPYLVKIGNHVAVAGGVTFMTHDGAAWVFRNEVPDLQVFGPIVIEDNCIIGQNAVLCPNVRIGPNSVVAAGSVVISDVPPNTLAMGVPARAWGSLEKYREKCLQRWAEQRPRGVVIEPGESWWNTRHHAANRERLRENLLALFDDQLGEPKQSCAPPSG